MWVLHVSASAAGGPSYVAKDSVEGHEAGGGHRGLRWDADEAASAHQDPAGVAFRRPERPGLGPGGSSRPWSAACGLSTATLVVHRSSRRHGGPGGSRTTVGP